MSTEPSTPQHAPIEYGRPRVSDLGDLVELTANGHKPHVFCDGQSGTIGNFGVGNADRVCSTPA